MPIPLAAPEVLDREYLEVRARLLQVAATLDRIDRAEGTVAADPRLGKIRAGLEVLLDGADRRAERIQLLFSLPYDEHWQEQFFPVGK
jgi:hypothetical protein